MRSILSDAPRACTRSRAARFFGVILVVTTAVFSAPLSADMPAGLAPYQFLLGSWIGIGEQAGATGGFTFKFDVQQHVIVRTNYSNTPATPGRPAARHDDLMVIYIESGTVHADYFDSEGHVIRYVTTVTPDAVAFVSVANPSEPRYRLTYRRGPGADTLTGAFEVAPPGRPDAFAPYLSWRARKTK